MNRSYIQHNDTFVLDILFRQKANVVGSDSLHVFQIETVAHPYLVGKRVVRFKLGELL